MHATDNKINRVGIMTFWSSNENYGQLLQVFALSKVIKGLGKIPVVIKYDGISDSSLKVSLFKRLLTVRPHSILKRILKKKSESQVDINDKERHFEDFRNNYLNFSRNYNSYRELKDNPPQCECFICGSDMIWCSQNKMKPYFLDFVPTSSYKISYAPSFGRAIIDKSYAEDIKTALKSFVSISVREESGAEIIRQLGYPNCKNLPDPTLLLTSSDYVESFRIEFSQKRKETLFAYILGNECDFSSKEQEGFCLKHNLEYVYTSSNHRKDTYLKKYLTIEQWVESIASAKYFVTNSFHGCVFAILFRTPFIFIPLKGLSGSSNERIYSLLKKTGLENRIYQGDLNILFNEIDFEPVHKIISNWRQEGLDFLSTSIFHK